MVFGAVTAGLSAGVVVVLAGFGVTTSKATHEMTMVVSPMSRTYLRCCLWVKNMIGVAISASNEVSKKKTDIGCPDLMGIGLNSACISGGVSGWV